VLCLLVWFVIGDAAMMVVFLSVVSYVVSDNIVNTADAFYFYDEVGYGLAASAAAVLVPKKVR